MRYALVSRSAPSRAIHALEATGEMLETDPEERREAKGDA